jgi:hypothetical protein
MIRDHDGRASFFPQVDRVQSQDLWGSFALNICVSKKVFSCRPSSCIPQLCLPSRLIPLSLRSRKRRVCARMVSLFLLLHIALASFFLVFLCASLIWRHISYILTNTFSRQAMARDQEGLPPHIRPDNFRKAPGQGPGTRCCKSTGEGDEGREGG